MRKGLGILILLASWVIGVNSYAQDIHFSQYLNSPLNLNPALSGFSDAKYRFILNHRSQWASVTVPYKTYSAAVDMQLWKRKRQRDIFGLGLVFNNDEAGDSHFGTTQGAISFSYIKALNRRNRNLLSFGAQLFFSQRSIDYTHLYFPNQWNGNAHDPNIQNGEYFSQSNFTYFDISAGVHWFSIANSNLNFNTGVSVWHINQPAQSLMNDTKVNLAIKILAYSEVQIDLDGNNALFPSIYFAQQGPFSELTLGLRYKYIVHPNSHNFTAINFGLFGRNADALILQFGLDYKKFKIMGSYDFNLSGLRSASNYLGGYEISIIFSIDKHKVRKTTSMPCPIF
ncbi:MAG: PorP/SprF family type IX secretion system membrane protein [Bacteroidales bacterium]|nr:PorP/SprF family type IX secretion system membrane protein [Bacteroidales bacterium]